MKTIDNRFDNELLKSFIGKTLSKVKYDHFRYTNTVTGIVGFMVENDSYAMINDYEQLDYLGWDDEACVCRIIKKPWDEIASYIDGEVQMETHINEVIKRITIINDHIESFSNDEKDYDIWETRAIIFEFDTYQISFTKQVCFFSMEIEINRGYGLIDKIEKTDKFYDEHDSSNGQILKISREINNIS